MLVGFDPDHRLYSRNKLIKDQVITINATVEKQLDQQIVNTTYIPKLDYHKNRLPEGEGIPINISL